MNKYIALTLILFAVGIVFTLEQCSFNADIHSIMNTPRIVGKYVIDSVANEVLLKKLYPDAEHSECGLADDDFMKYAKDRIDHTRQFQFMVFIDGKPLVGERCWRGALIFYLREGK